MGHLLYLIFLSLVAAVGCPAVAADGAPSAVAGADYFAADDHVSDPVSPEDALVAGFFASLCGTSRWSGGVAAFDLVFTTSVHSPIHLAYFVIASIFPVLADGWGCCTGLFPRQDFEKIGRPPKVTTFGMSMKFILVNETIILKSPVAMPALLLTDETSATLSKKNRKCSSVMYNNTPYKVNFFFWLPIYSACNLTDFVVRMFPAKELTSSSVASSLSHMGLLLRTNIWPLCFGYLGSPPIVPC